MKWEAVTLIVVFSLSSLMSIADIGKPRKPLTQCNAVGGVIMTVGLVTLAWRLGTTP